MIGDLKLSNPRQWYSKLKRISKFNPHEIEQPECEEISAYDEQQQAELIADAYEAVAGRYDWPGENDVQLPEVCVYKFPQVKTTDVLKHITSLKNNTATVANDVPIKIIKRISKHLLDPLTHIINTQITRGEFPKIWKVEQVLAEMVINLINVNMEIKESCQFIIT